MRTSKNIVVIGGGTGTYMVLSGLKRLKDVWLSAIVTMSDDGGNTGDLRDDLGVLPPGDLRQCLVALSDDRDDAWRKLFSFRFAEGSGNMSGQSVGNIILSALEKIYGDPFLALATAHRLLDVKGRVIPVTLEGTTLCAECEDGTTIRGEHNIDVSQVMRAPIKRCYFETSPRINSEATAAIQDADAVVIGPGDFWTSIAPNLIVPEIPRALRELQENGGRVFFVCNLVTKRGETDGYKASDFRNRINELISPAHIDVTIVNSAKPAQAILERYRETGEYPVEDDLPHRDPSVCRQSLISPEIGEAVSGDKIRRSLLRHHGETLAQAIQRLLPEN
ncbi:YvcK family protein [Patescibacteria group bacterium]|nr:YvcK family protein [Patescibacteria group bacterium]